MRKLAALGMLCLLATGCRHRQRPVPAITLPPAQPLPLEKAPETAGVVPPVPVVMAPLPSRKIPVVRAKKPKKKPVPAVPVPAATQVASAGAPAPAANLLGALTAGGADTPETQKKAADLLGALEKRLAGLPKSVSDKQPEQVARVKYFWSQAHAALMAGDADGAFNLATKAKVLLDDVAR